MKTIIILLIAALCASTLAESRIWKLTNGKTVEGEFVSLVGGNILLKSPKGKNIKYAGNLFSQEDLDFIELEMPPRLDIELSKITEQRVFPETHSRQLPRSLYYSFTCKIKQVSSIQYNPELTAEMFCFAEELDGDKKILVDYQKHPFKLTEGTKSIIEFSSKKVELLDYNITSQRRGEQYEGYLILITDTRGKIIAHKTTHERYFKIHENLRNLAVGKFFDKEGSRCYPTRPKRMY